MATLPTTTSKSVGAKVQALDWNTYVKGNDDFFIFNRPVCLAYTNVTQSIATSAATNLLFELERIDRDNQHNTATNTDRVVIGNTLGWYRVTATVSWAANATGVRNIFIGLNGATVTGAYMHGSATGAVQVQQVTTIVQATASTDFVTAGVFQSAGVALSTNITTSTSSILVEWIGS